MSYRPILLLLACLAVLPACKKKKTDDGGGSTDTGPTPPATVNSDFVVYAHLRAKDIRESAVFAEVKQAVDKSGGKDEWDKIEGKAGGELGMKPTDIDAVTVWVTEVPPREMPKFIAIITSSKPIDRATAFGLGKTKPDARGFYTAHAAEGLVHFPDEKTVVLLHPSLAQKYLDGYAKNRTGWPVSAELTRAAAGHTLFALVQFDKVPSEMLRAPDIQEFAPVLAARKITVTADLKGKELNIGARVGFADAGAAGRAKDSTQKFIGMAVREVEKVMNGKGPSEINDFMPAVKEAHRALKDAKVEVAGSDLTIAGSYKANFDIGAMVSDAIKKYKKDVPLMAAQNNLKQIGLALHNFSSVHAGPLPVHAVGANGVPLKTPNDKPLLSWRVAILPYIEQDTLYKQFKLNEPWDSPNNKKLIEQMPKIFAPLTPGKPGYTHLQMVIGPNALSPVGTRMPASFPDGTANTIAVVEAAESVIWTKPDDLMMPGNQWPKDFRKKFGGLTPGGFHVLLWDGQVRLIRDTVSDRTLGIALNPRDGLVLPGDW